MQSDQVWSLHNKKRRATHKYASRSHREDSLPWFHRWIGHCTRIIAIELLPFNPPDEYFFGSPKGCQLQSAVTPGASRSESGRQTPVESLPMGKLQRTRRAVDQI
jgi:hypothetical protein